MAGRRRRVLPGYVALKIALEYRDTDDVHFVGRMNCPRYAEDDLCVRRLFVYLCYHILHFPCIDPERRRGESVY